MRTECSEGEGGCDAGDWSRQLYPGWSDSHGAGFSRWIHGALGEAGEVLARLTRTRQQHVAQHRVQSP